MSTSEHPVATPLPESASSEEAAIRTLQAYLLAGFPLVYIVSPEEQRVEAAIRVAAGRGKQPRTVIPWCVSRGFIAAPATVAAPEKGDDKADPVAALQGIHAVKSDALLVYVLRDFHAFMNDVVVCRWLRDVAHRLPNTRSRAVIVAPTLVLPPGLEKLTAVIDWPLPDSGAIARQIDQQVGMLLEGRPAGEAAAVFRQPREEIVAACRGLTLDEVDNTLAKTWAEYHHIDVAPILAQKEQTVRKTGTLELTTATGSLADVGGLEVLKAWLVQRRKAFAPEAAAFGLPSPRGVLLAGVSGGGKSLCAKVAASVWRFPLLRFDFGRLFGSLVGESEQKLRDALRIIEAVAPVVVLLDEAEKMFGQGDRDGGTAQRMLGTFLTWMQDRPDDKPVFLIASVNDVTRLPPEMLRKGRFDEIFFVDLPHAAEREAIFAVHLRKRKRQVAQFDLHALADATDGFSGAEIEAVVIDGLHAAFEDNARTLTTADLLAAVKVTVPLSTSMRERLEALRAWAEGRARKASKPSERNEAAPARQVETIDAVAVVAIVPMPPPIPKGEGDGVN